MPTVRIPLVGNISSRDDVNLRLFGTAQKDQYFKNCHFRVIKNELSGKLTVYVMARDGYSASAYPASTSGEGTAIRYWNGFSNGGILYQVVSAWGNTNSTLYLESTSLGAITGQAKFIDETTLSDVPTILVVSTDNTGWYMPQDAYSQTSYTGDTHTNTIVDNIASTAGMYSGQAISGTNIPASTRILTVDSSTQITLNAATTGTTAGVTLTKTPIAKILDADFPGNASQTIVGHFAPIDGYAALMTSSGRVYTSAVNSLSSWVSSDYIVAQEYPDPGLGVLRLKNMIVAFSKSSIEFFQNAGNAAGSPLSRIQHLAQKIGCISQYSMCEINNTIAWIGPNSGVMGIYIFDGTSPVKISDALMDWNLENLSSTNFRLHALYSMGKSYLAFVPAKGATGAYVYDFETRIWQQWVLEYGITQSDCPSGGISGVYYLGDDSAFWATNSTVTDVTAEIQTVPVDFGSSRRKTAETIRLIGDHAPSSSTVAVSWSDDGYVTYSTARNIDMSSVDPKLSRCGVFRRRGFKLANIGDSATNVRLRLTHLEIDYEDHVL